MGLTLILGGARAGKSALAQRLAEARGGPVTVVATARADDASMAARIARHRTDRPAGWRTIEEPIDLAAAMARVPDDGVLIIDCLTVWVANLMDAGLTEEAAVEAATALAGAAAARLAPTVAVSNEVGMGVHPVTALGRDYQDLLGRVNALWARAADTALLLVAGRAVPLVAPETILRAAGTAGAMSVADLVAAVRPLDVGAAERASERQERLAKPPGSLGALERLAVRLAAIARRCPPPVPGCAGLVICAADHGVVASGASIWPSAVTRSMVATFLSGGAAANALAAEVGADLLVVDVGVAGQLPASPRLRAARVRAGTADITRAPAMERGQAAAAIAAGADAAQWSVERGRDLIVCGDMGIGNTTAAACLIACFTGAPPEAVTGPGAGGGAAHLATKRRLVAAALERARPRPSDPLGVLSEVGGLEHAALVGVILGAAGAGVPVVLDGVSTNAAALAAVALCPEALGYLIAGHRSTEPGAAIALEHLGLEALLDLGLHLGEGTGGLLAVPLVRAAARALATMTTLEEVGAA